MKTTCSDRVWLLLIAATTVLLAGAPAAAEREVWVKRYADVGNAIVEDMALDGSGNVVVTGYADGGAAVGMQHVTVKYDPSGNTLWTKHYNGPITGGYDAAHAVAVDSAGNACITGTMNVGGEKTYIATSKHAKSDGALLWGVSSVLVGSNASGNAIAVDTLDNVYVAGGWGGDYITKMYDAATGWVLWDVLYHGPGVDTESTPFGIALDDQIPQNIYVTGESRSSGGDSDYATVMYDAGGNEQWVIRYNGLGGSSWDEACAIAVHDVGSMFVAGSSDGDFATVKYTQGDVGDCQGIDSPDSDVLYVNGSQGGSDHTVSISGTAPLSFLIQKPPAGGNGKFVVHLNRGEPNVTTVRPLPASLGSTCFPFLIPPYGTASPVAIWNCLGKTSKVGSSKYYGTTIPNPARAPTAFLAEPDGDPTHFPVGSVFTLQGIILNPAATSPKGASVTNAIVIHFTS